MQAFPFFSADELEDIGSEGVRVVCVATYLLVHSQASTYTLNGNALKARLKSDGDHPKVLEMPVGVVRKRKGLTKTVFPNQNIF